VNCGNSDGNEESSKAPLARSKGSGRNRVSATAGLTRIRSDYEYRNAAKTINKHAEDSPRFETECIMIAKYDIFKLRSDGSFVRVEAVEDILAAKQRLDVLSAKNPGDYHLWDSSTHKFVNPYKESASSR